jgi:hypothetical protein
LWRNILSEFDIALDRVEKFLRGFDFDRMQTNYAAKLYNMNRFIASEEMKPRKSIDYSLVKPVSRNLCIIGFALPNNGEKRVDGCRVIGVMASPGEPDLSFDGLWRKAFLEPANASLRDFLLNPHNTPLGGLLNEAGVGPIRMPIGDDMKLKIQGWLGSRIFKPPGPRR